MISEKLEKIHTKWLKAFSYSGWHWINKREVSFLTVFFRIFPKTRFKNAAWKLYTMTSIVHTYISKKTAL